MDIIIRLMPLVDHLIVAVTQHSEKKPFLSAKDRVDFIRHELHQNAKCNQTSTIVEVRSFDGLLVTFAQSVGARMIVRGLRAVSDFEYEFQMAAVNGKLAPEIETMFLMASSRFQFISSRFVKEVARLGGDASHFVSPHVHQKLIERFSLEV